MDKIFHFDSPKVDESINFIFFYFLHYLTDFQEIYSKYSQILHELHYFVAPTRFHSVANDPNIGKITALTAGTTTISATTSTGSVANCVVTVLETGVEKAIYQLWEQYNMVFIPSEEDLNEASIQSALSYIRESNDVEVVVVSVNTDNLTAVIYFKDVDNVDVDVDVEDTDFQVEVVTITLARELTPEYALDIFPMV